MLDKSATVGSKKKKKKGKKRKDAKLTVLVVMNTTPACAVVLALTTSNRHMLSHRWKAFLSVGLGAQAKLCKCLVLNES